MQKVPIKKAPGYDGIDFIVLKTIFRTHPEIFITFYNKCLSLQCFPNPLKTGVIVLFLKKRKNKSDIKSYRPVSLLPTLGKILEKLLLERLNHHLRRNSLQHPNQYGFRTNRSTEEAILDLLDKINSTKNSNQHALMISLDIKGEFDHLQYTSIKNSLDNLKYHSNTLETLIDILSNRKVATNTSQGPATWNQQQGCPQGSCTGPAFWNLVPTNCSSKTGPKGCTCRHLQMICLFGQFRVKTGLKNVAGTSWGLSKNIRRQLYLTVVEKVILYASAEWAHIITARQQKLLSSIQRKFLFNITGAYNTTPTAALQVIEGLMPLHTKANMQSTLVRVGRLGRNCDYEGIHFDHESYEQPSPPSTIHPARFSLEDRISHGGQVPSNRTPIEVHTDGSKINDQTDSAFCAIANEAITKTWKAKMSPANTVFQAEMLVFKAAIEWANTANENVNI
ncbi:hypothetical protein AVEN_241397-1 [Araneus ventricosus]|uniref:Reverse transcriptase domain-containing protein n=1 Tax=Araneus ventricosus TaxID=182803 RepID=A0A4Y2H2N3_ARAVE|nr:hypothetical protein AVEN_241397-1 [Araneus ventricosus]